MRIWSKTNFLPYFAISSLETQPMNLTLTRNAAKTLSTNFGYTIMAVCLLLVVLCFAKIRETNMMTPRKMSFLYAADTALRCLCQVTNQTTTLVRFCFNHLSVSCMCCCNIVYLFVTESMFWRLYLNCTISLLKIALKTLSQFSGVSLLDYNFPKVVQYKIKVIDFLLSSYNISSKKKVLIILSHKLLKVDIFPHYYSNTYFLFYIFYLHSVCF